MGVSGTGLVAGFPMWPENTCWITHETLAKKHFRLQLDIKVRDDCSFQSLLIKMTLNRGITPKYLERPVLLNLDDSSNCF